MSAYKRIGVYIGTMEFLREAIKEFEESIKSSDEAKIRDSTEKAWNTVI